MCTKCSCVAMKFGLSRQFEPVLLLQQIDDKESTMSLPTSEEVRELIKTKVKDPELMMNIVDLGLVYDIQVTPEKTAEITMTLTSPGCPAGPEIITNAQRETHLAFPDLEEVNVHLTWTPFWNPDMMSQEAKDELGYF